jgi:hypothetical protein
LIDYWFDSDASGHATRHPFHSAVPAPLHSPPFYQRYHKFLAECLTHIIASITISTNIYLIRASFDFEIIIAQTRWIYTFAPRPLNE